MTLIRRALTVMALPAAAVLSGAGCYDPPVRERVTLTIEPGGRLDLTVETIFKQGKDLMPAEKEAIQRALDLYELGRDPWLRGLDRAFAVEVSHERRGDEKTPQGITRKGSIPSVESLADVMPDAIANFKLSEDPEKETRTLRIVHIDVPESVRENRRRMEKEIEAFATLGFRFSETHCDLYDYLAEHPERRRDILQALVDEKHVEGMLTPEETALIRALTQAFEALSGFGNAAGGGAAPFMASLSFAAFEHDFCVKLPAEAMAAVGLVRSAEQNERTTYCAPRLTLGDLTDEVFPEADPALLDDDLLKKLLDDPEKLAAEPFSCLRYDNPKALEQKIWDRILPLPYYELVWEAGNPTSIPSSRSRRAW
jgi:hypothetical protein